MLAELFSHGADWHDLAGVPEQMAKHHQAGVGRQALLQGIEDPSIRRARITAEMLHRKHVDAQLLATG